MKKRSIDTNKSIRKVKKEIKLLMKNYPDASFKFIFKEGKRTGSHCYLLNIKTPVGNKNINVIKTNKSYSSNLGVVHQAKRFLDYCLNIELAWYLHGNTEKKITSIKIKNLI
tara:strand:- start:87 stop:422 length:336 start_codon:yes stop_codon:yes gene_type:complete